MLKGNYSKNTLVCNEKIIKHELMEAKETGWNRNWPQENPTDKNEYLNKNRVYTDSARWNNLFWFDSLLIRFSFTLYLYPLIQICRTVDSPIKTNRRNWTVKNVPTMGPPQISIITKASLKHAGKVMSNAGTYCAANF